MSDFAQLEARALELQKFVKTELGEWIISEIESIILSNTMSGDTVTNPNSQRHHDIANGARQSLGVLFNPIQDMESGRLEELRKMEKDLAENV